jgi:hypothetical protein
MTIKELFEGPVGDYCIARNTVKCLLLLDLVNENIIATQNEPLRIFNDKLFS